ncbi:DUF2066 domain-containing protein [Mesorhizobium sp. KR9-304]|uniref:DUF2066 domain-containing protein n=1 Tax=Mesorhizobium sp. KR9-304 TaxID=3156614 RepID=UPI0032B54AC9
MILSIRLACLLILAFVPAAPGYAAEAAGDLYSAQAVVTGQGEKNRQLGFRECLDRVLVRMSGDQRLLARPELAGLRNKAGALIASFKYRDRLEGIPIHDEQGSHDRPHDLSCLFDRAKVDAALASMGSKPWLAERPVVAVFLSVERGTQRFVLTADGDDGPFMDESLAAAAEPLAMQMVLPSRARIEAARLDARTLLQPDFGVLKRAAKDVGGDVPLLGRLAWSDAELGWVADWRIAFEGKTYDWQVRGVSFDEAFRVAMRGAAQVLSGNGQP